MGGDDGLNPSSRCSVVNCTRKLLHSPPESPSRLSSTPESQNQSKTSSIVVRLWKSYLYYFNSWDGNERWGCCSVQKKKKRKKDKKKKKIKDTKERNQRWLIDEDRNGGKWRRKRGAIAREHTCRANQSKHNTSVWRSVLLLDDNNWRANQSM